MARMLASGAVAGMAQPAFRMKRRVAEQSDELTRFRFNERGRAWRDDGAGVEVADKDGAVRHEVVGEADVGLVVESEGVGTGGDQVGEDRLGIAADMQRVGDAEGAHVVTGWHAPG
jgi:hypothetical protein